jgi:uncharacterized delta-60 repeat protein
MKKFFTLLLLTVIQYSQAQTCNPLDNDFGVNGKATGFSTTGTWINVRNLMVQSDGKILQVSNTHNSGFMAVRYNANGSPDYSYGANSIAAAFSGQATDAARGVLQSDGKLVVVGTLYNPGSYSDVALARFNTNGTADNTFGTGGKVIVPISSFNNAGRGLAIQPDGKIVVAGHSSGNCFNDCINRQFCRPLFTLLRLNPDGATDSSFGQNGRIVLAPGSFNSGIASSVLIQPDGKIIALGDVQNYSCGDCSGGFTTASGFLMARFLPNGTPDNSFGLNGQVMDTLLQRLSAALLQPNGRIVMTAQTGQGNFLTRRYNNDGSVDIGFLENTITTGWINDMLLLPDGKLALAGGTSVDNQPNFLILRLKNNGVFDSSFNGSGRLHLRVGAPGNTDEGATALALQGTQLLAGGFTQNNSNPNTRSQYSQVVVRIGAAGTGIPVSVSPAGPHYPCTGETVTLRPSLAGFYQWYRNDTAINGAIGSSYTVTSSGNYAVSVTNMSGCGMSNAVLVQYNALPVSITPLSSLNICSGDSVQLQSNESGTVQWYKDNVAIAGATNPIYAAKTAGAYHVTVKNAKGCGQSSPVSVNVSSVKPDLQWDGTKLSTDNGYFSYRWYLNGSVIAGATSNVLSPLATGLYRVAIADFGCDTTSNELNLTCSMVNVTTPVISWTGSSLTTPATYTAYQWLLNNNPIAGANQSVFQPVQTGTYRVTVTGPAGCTNTSAAFVLECNQVGPSKPIVGFNGTTFSTNAGYERYQWYYNDTAISGATTQAYTPVLGQFGTYKVTVTNGFGCSNTSDAAPFTPQVLLLGDLFLRVYPNPANEKMMIEISQPAAQTPTATLYDLQGRRLLQRVLKAGPNSIPVYQLAAASYVLEIRYGKEKVVLKAVVVR